MIGEITEAAEALGADPGVRVVVLAAEGASFCAGGDLGWMRAQMAADAATRAREARRLARMLRALNELPKPLIGRVQGNAFGGGVGMVSVCDVAVGALPLRMGLTETRLGLIPATIGPYVVARMGEAMARRVFFSARLFGAEEAVRLGLLARAVPEGGARRRRRGGGGALSRLRAGGRGGGQGACAGARPPDRRRVIDASIAALVRRLGGARRRPRASRPSSTSESRRWADG
jgi:methylglutaconyl-CoA hydratase